MEKLQIQIPRKVYRKIQYWMAKADIEVSGFGKVMLLPNGTISVLDAYLLKQEGGAAHTDIDGQSLGKLMFDTKDVPGELKWWWHSHVDMSVFWSGQDTTTINELSQADWCGATVFNRKGEMRSAVGIASHHDLFGTSVSVKDNLPTFIIDPNITQADVDGWDAEYILNVKEKEEFTYLNQYNKSYTSNTGKDYTSSTGKTLIDISKHTKSEAHVHRHNKDEDEYTELYRIMRDFGMNAGMFGYGLDLEAKALGMTELAYMRILAKDSKGQVKKLETKLERLMENGKLDELWESTHGPIEPASDKATGSDTN